MAKNPMQRKANNSFLLGILITLLITGAIIAFLIFQIMDLNKTIDEQQASLTQVYVLSSDVKSGQIITNDMLTTMNVFSSTVPQNAIGDLSVLSSYYLADEQGNQAYTGYKVKDPDNLLGDAINLGGSVGNKSMIVDSDGYIIFTEEEYNALEDYLSSQPSRTGQANRTLLDDVYDAQDANENGEKEIQAAQYITRTMIVGDTTINVNCEIKFDEDLEQYYILVPETTATSITRSATYNYTKEMLEEMPLIAKVDMYANTVITPDLVAEGQLTRDDIRKQEYNIITLPTQIQTGDYVDIRLRLPDGQDLIVVSHKEVEIPTIENVDSTNCIWLNLSEDEILTLSCAIVESYEMSGAMLYATRYVDPGLQDAAEPTYVPNTETMALVNNDPNIVEQAKAELLERYQNDITTGDDTIVRQSIDDYTTYEDPEEAADRVTDRTEEEITSLQDAREEYIDSLV